MSEFLTFVVAGLTVGSLYALVAVGLVLTYRTSGVLNFGYGALAFLAVDAYIYVTFNRGWSWQVGAAVAVVGVGFVAGVLLEPLARVLARVPAAHQVVATIGLLIAIQAASTLIGPHLAGNHPHTIGPPLPGSTVSIAGVNVGEDQIIIMAVSLSVGLALWAFLGRSRAGVAMRAVVVNAELLDLCGTRPVVVRRAAWITGSLFACLSGMLIALSPSYGLNPELINLVILPAFAGAALGGFTSLPLAYLGGLIVGIVSALLTRYTINWLTGLAATAPYIILFFALVVLSVVRPTRVSGRAAKVVERRPFEPSAPVGVLAGAVLLAAMLAAPAWAGFGISVYTTTLVFVVVFLSLGLLLKTAGMASLCQLGFAAVGATAFGRLATNAHLPWFLALLVAVLAAGLSGGIVAVPAIRLSGAFLSLATVAFGFILEQLVYPTGIMFGRTEGSLQAPRPDFASSDRAYYYLVVVFVIASAAVVWMITRSRLGRLVRGLADSPVALQVQGASTNVTRLLIFVISASLAGLAGALLGGLDNFVTPTYFSANASLTLVALLFLVRVGDPWYAFIAASVYYLLPEKVSWTNAATWISLASGALAVYAVVAGGLDRSRRERSTWARCRRRPGLTEPDAGLVPGHPPAPETLLLGVPARTGCDRGPVPEDAVMKPDQGLEVNALTVRFGGLTALNDVSLVARAGAITGLIGPNGAGKTTLLNACSGFVVPTSGSVSLDDHDLSHLSPSARARRGLGRTFQHIEIFESLTVRDTVGLSREAALAGANPYHHLTGRSPGRGPARSAVDDAIESAGVSHIANRTVAGLSTGERRLVELARCLAWPFAMVLLDEPTAGLDRGESDRFGEILSRVVASRNLGVLIIEHDVHLVMDLCSWVAVLDFARMLFEGEPADVMSSDEVRAAYLGESVGRPAG